MNDCLQWGWKKGTNDDIVSIDWEDLDSAESFVSSYVTCGCKTGCNTGRCKCFNVNATCNVKCKCKGCTNKVVLGGLCGSNSSNCETIGETEDSSDESESDEEMLDVQMFVDNCLDDIALCL